MFFMFIRCCQIANDTTRCRIHLTMVHSVFD